MIIILNENENTNWPFLMENSEDDILNIIKGFFTGNVYKEIKKKKNNLISFHCGITIILQKHDYVNHYILIISQ